MALAALVLLTTALTSASERSEPFRLRAAELQKLVEKTTDGLAAAQLPTGADGPIVVVARREQTGEVELHEHFNDIFVAHSGKATVLAGGKAEGHRQTTPGEWRGGKITGAQAYEMAPGDVVWIPAGLPHQVVVPDGGVFVYMAFKSPGHAR